MQTIDAPSCRRRPNGDRIDYRLRCHGLRFLVNDSSNLIQPVENET
jgi:hypothetical protein